MINQLNKLINLYPPVNKGMPGIPTAPRMFSLPESRVNLQGRQAQSKLVVARVGLGGKSVKGNKRYKLPDIK